MFKKLLLITSAGVILSGCYMAPLALLGPATSGFSTASIIQYGVTTTGNMLVKKSTGKTFSEHAMDAINKEVLKQTYFPVDRNPLVVAP